jgi:hypothetical protein
MKCSSALIGEINCAAEMGSLVDVMLARQEILMVDSVAQPYRPIEFQTDNGFSIVRLSDITDSIPRRGLVHQFLVRDPDGFELEVTVEINQTLAEALAWRSRGRLSGDSSYWLCCAERHLAEYLLDNEDYPPDGKLTVDEPILEDLNLAPRWGTETETV